MRGRLILLALVGAASATAVTGAVISAMPRTPATVQASAVEETSARMPGVALEDDAATVHRFLGYENAPTPEPAQPPLAPSTPRYRSPDRVSSDTGGSDDTADTGSTGSDATVAVPTDPTPSPSPSSPDPTPSPTPTGDGSTPGGVETPGPDEPGTTAPRPLPVDPPTPGSAEDTPSQN